MSKYVSRKYLREKYNDLKWDMEKTLEIDNLCKQDKITEQQLNKVKANIVDKCLAIVNELT